MFAKHITAGLAGAALLATAAFAQSPTATSDRANMAPAATASKPNPWHPDHAVFNATKDELKAMPEFKYNT